MLEVINRLLCFIGNLLQTDPNQNGTRNVISNNSSFATLATFQSSQLLGFAMKLLNFPTEATHLSYGLRVVLRHVVGHNIVRALRRRRKAQPEIASPYDCWEIL